MDTEDKRRTDKWDADYEQDCIDDGNAIRGIAIGIVVMLVIAWAVYRCIAWYVSTMPPIVFH